MLFITLSLCQTVSFPSGSISDVSTVKYTRWRIGCCFRISRTAALPMKSASLFGFTKKPTPASMGFVSTFISAPHARNPFSSRRELRAYVPKSPIPYSLPASSREA
ncbi:hypothetical protein NP493_445g00023 [Ridgeia piscesae]|uniref:Uncharacterized protein n=1 Tax=Ridgeia piscesae TaxID=27915 RepID=A0AAD9NRR5_RIDPI|nr:hypothetical protein NP493_445g00023 [Ridgeia piscesae]